MNRTVEITIDSLGRLVIPEAVSERLHLNTGMTLVVDETDGEGAHLIVRRHDEMLVKKEGVLIVQGEAVGDIASVLRNEREQRTANLY